MSARAPRFLRRTSAIAALALVSLHVAPAWADAKAECVAASEKAQVLRSDGKMLASRERLLACARDVCPAVVRKDCTRWLAEVEEALPTVVIAAKDAEGHDVVDVKVVVDGTVLVESLDGKAQPLDPGLRVFEFVRSGSPTVIEKVLVREGEKNRIVSVSFAPKEPPNGAPKGEVPSGDVSPKIAPPADRGPPVAAFVLGGIGVAALSSFAFFGLSARSQASDLRARCAPSCAQSDVDALKTKILVADVSLGVGLVSLGVATFLFLSPRASSEPKTASTTTFGFEPLRGGGALQLAGVF